MFAPASARCAPLPNKVRIKIDGTRWFKGDATCVLVGNVSTATAGLVVFNDAVPDDGVLDVGVVTAEGTAQWLRVLGRAARKKADRSPFVQTTTARGVDVRMDEASLYELDGGSRSKVTASPLRGQAEGDHGARPDMSTATLIPETWELTGDDARKTSATAVDGSCCAMRSSGSGGRTASATPGRWRSCSAWPWCRE